MDSQVEGSGGMAMLEDPAYRQSYESSILIMKNVIPFISSEEEASRRLKSCATDLPRLVAAGLHALESSTSRTRSLSEAAAMCRDAIVLLSYCRDLHGRFVNGTLCTRLIDSYHSLGERLGVLLKEKTADCRGDLS